MIRSKLLKSVILAFVVLLVAYDVPARERTPAQREATRRANAALRRQRQQRQRAAAERARQRAQQQADENDQPPAHDGGPDDEASCPDCMSNGTGMMMTGESDPYGSNGRRTETPPAPGCGNDALTSKNIYKLPGAGYWMQSGGDCYVTYTSIGGISSKLYNTCTRQAEPITDEIDAYALPQGDLYVHPHNGISFYKLSKADMQKNIDGMYNGNESAVFNDPDHVGNYESIGMLPGSTDNDRKVRIAMGSQGGTIRDYRIEKNGGEYKFTALQPSVTRICGNLENGGIDTEIPILSRDGQMIAGRELDSRKTGIYKIEMPAGDCKLLKMIPSQTSKVSFNFDNKNVMYVIKDPNTGKGRLMQMNIDTGKVRTLSGPDEDVMYVTAKPNGNILYTRAFNGGANTNQTSELVEMGADQVGDATAPKNYEAMGMLWAKKCGKTIDLDTAYAVGQRMTKNVCDLTLQSADLSVLDADHRSLTKDVLVGSCGQSGGATNGAAGTR